MADPNATSSETLGNSGDGLQGEGTAVDGKVTDSQTTPTPAPVDGTPDGSQAKPDPVAEGKAERTFSQDEFSKMQSSMHRSYEEKVTALRGDFHAELDRVQEENRLAQRALMSRIMQPAPDPYNDTPTGATKEEEEYQAHIAKTDAESKKRRSAMSTTQQVNKFREEMWNRLSNANIDPTSTEVTNILDPLMKEGNINAVRDAVITMVTEKQVEGRVTNGVSEQVDKLVNERVAQIAKDKGWTDVETNGPSVNSPAGGDGMKARYPTMFP